MTQPPAYRNIAARGLWRRTPPAIFPPVMGLLGLALAWRRAGAAAGLPEGAADLLAGAASLLFGAAALAYLGKLARRPGVVAEDLRILPGRAGIAAANLSILLFAVIMVPYAPRLALVLVPVALVSHVALGGFVLRMWLYGPEEARLVTPVWHLTFVGYIIAPLSLIPLGYQGIAGVIFHACLPVAALVWGVSLIQILRRIPPAPLRPLLAIHLAPASLFATSAAMLGYQGWAAFFTFATVAILLILLVFSRWITASGFSALWGAFTFPLAAASGALLANGWTVAGLVLTVAATAVILPIAAKILQGWLKGGLAAATNAATA